MISGFNFRKIQPDSKAVMERREELQEMAAIEEIGRGFIFLDTISLTALYLQVLTLAQCSNQLSNNMASVWIKLNFLISPVNAQLPLSPRLCVHVQDRM